ncbi:hypothetical protein K450DRAFT_228394 [Umbelopsis ramanniana AG]|uniref:Uncharacterized protein n=1 Tax=Umbelopsis ramanniana AG TaxID=1314678 RepID=A0AAD5HFD4_UMBRA|nr:uncharacterized protein K450DRAFT_228394 [Umbelopsis ramanniana AG]KAI8582315.1 hypothetical protein K450DRAFT_228394 [Umbelopsis ramanniana AG]
MLMKSFIIPYLSSVPNFIHHMSQFPEPFKLTVSEAMVFVTACRFSHYRHSQTISSFSVFHSLLP